MMRAPKWRVMGFRAPPPLPRMTSATRACSAAPLPAEAMPGVPLGGAVSGRPPRMGSASWRMRRAARSLTEPPGLNHSSLAWISTPGGSSERSRTRGVLPTAWVRESRIKRPAPREWQRAPPQPPPPPRRRKKKKKFFFLHGRRGRSRGPGGGALRARPARPPPPGRSRWRPGSGPPRAPPARCPERETRHPAGGPDRTRPEAGGGRTVPVGWASASARDRRNDGEPVALFDGGGQALRVPHVLVVAEDVDVPAQRALVVEQLLLDAGVLARQLLGRRLHAGRVLDGHLALVGGERPQGGWDLHGDGHGRFLSSYDAAAAQAAQAGSRRSGSGRWAPRLASHLYSTPASGVPRRICSAARAMAAPTRPQSGESTPASAQAGTAPGGGGPSNRQRRHPVRPGRMVRSWPVHPSAAPWTSGMPLRTASSLAKKRVSKLSVPSRSTSASPRIWAAVPASNRATRASPPTRRAATSALSAPTSSSPKRICRARLDRSTRSGSTRTMRRSSRASDSASAAGQPSPPAPRMTAVFTAPPRPARTRARPAP